MTSLGVNTTLRTKPQESLLNRKKKRRKKNLKRFFGCCVINIFKKTKTKLINSQTCKDKIQLTSELTRLFKSKSFFCHHFFALSFSVGSPIISVPLSTT